MTFKKNRQNKYYHNRGRKDHHGEVNLTTTAPKSKITVNLSLDMNI